MPDTRTGTRSDVPMSLAERAEHWVHTNERRADHPDVVWEHHIGSIPDGQRWEHLGRDHGRAVLDAAVATLRGE